MELVYRCEIIRLKTINILARSVEGSKDHGAEIGTPVVLGNCWVLAIREGRSMRSMSRTLVQAPKRKPVEHYSTPSLHSTGPASIGSHRANSVTRVFSGEPKRS